MCVVLKCESGSLPSFNNSVSGASRGWIYYHDTEFPRTFPETRTHQVAVSSDRSTDIADSGNLEFPEMSGNISLL